MHTLEVVTDNSSAELLSRSIERESHETYRHHTDDGSEDVGASRITEVKITTDLNTGEPDFTVVRKECRPHEYLTTRQSDRILTADEGASIASFLVDERFKNIAPPLTMDKGVFMHQKRPVEDVPSFRDYVVVDARTKDDIQAVYDLDITSIASTLGAMDNVPLLDLGGDVFDSVEAVSSMKQEAMKRHDNFVTLAKQIVRIMGVDPSTARLSKGMAAHQVYSIVESIIDEKKSIPPDTLAALKRFQEMYDEIVEYSDKVNKTAPEMFTNALSKPGTYGLPGGFNALSEVERLRVGSMNYLVEPLSIELI